MRNEAKLDSANPRVEKLPDEIFLPEITEHKKDGTVVIEAVIEDDFDDEDNLLSDLEMISSERFKE